MTDASDPANGHDAYRRIARVYDRLLGPVLTGMKRRGLDLCPPRPGMVVLDVGCGTGAQLELYRGSGCQLRGIDPSPAMVAIARATLGAAARIDLAHASRIPVPDASVDLVLLSLMLHELPDATRSAVISDVLRVLKPEGRAIALDYHPGPLLIPWGYGVRGLILIAERLAGFDHYRHHLEFLAAGGIPAVAKRFDLQIDQSLIVKGGTFGLYVLSRLRELAGPV